ncbi:hypothetical protein FisN_26Lh119 [Fistulifera solaris]|uniref:Shugoshin C-terminal domain-containing protein n=1 Tax=Fistulifera solaris TaxID=1519565 RepID=A0A1Z5KCQ8_FISSO|nr:hypothetical protein FisN_26Lh119 [Fistulifera solaris]|eukprot:GAX24049.1 hypothetical protein FisN_26Lh119 [Fistulifera solaris]
MRKAVAQVASKARGNNTANNKRNRDDTASSRSISPSKRAISPPKRGKEVSSTVKSHTQMTPDEAALAAKNYRLAKELSELRVRHREESKTVTKLTMENMTLASKCREVMQQAALYKQQLDQQKATMANWQRQNSEIKVESSPVLVSSDDFEERDFSTESEITPTPLLVSPSKAKSPLRESPLSHRFFPPSTSPKEQRKTAYNEEFPGDIITPKVTSRRSNFHKMGRFEELECEDDIELWEAPKDDSRHRDAPGLEKKEQSQRDMSSLDAFEASFQTDFARSFSSSDNVPPSHEIYDPFSNSPVKINLSAATPIIEKPYEAEPRSPSRGAFASDPPGVDKTSTRPNGPLSNESKSKVIPPPPPPRAKTGGKNHKSSGSSVSSTRSTPSELQSVAAETASRIANTSSKQSQSTTVPRVAKSMLLEQSVASPQSVSQSSTADSVSKSKVPATSPKHSQPATVPEVTKSGLFEQAVALLESGGVAPPAGMASNDKAPVVSPKQSQAAPLPKVTKPAEQAAPADSVSNIKVSVKSPKQNESASVSKVANPVLSEHPAASRESGGLVSPVNNVSKKKVGSASKSISPVLSEEPRNIANKISLAEQVLTVQSKAALLLSTPELPKMDDSSKGNSTNSESTPKSPKSYDKAEKGKGKSVSPRESPKRDKPTVPAQRPTNSTPGSIKDDERATVGQTKIVSSTEKPMESSIVNKESVRNTLSKSPTSDNQAEVKTKEVNSPLHVPAIALPDVDITSGIGLISSESQVNSKEKHGASGASSTDALQADMMSSSKDSESNLKHAQYQGNTELAESAQFLLQPVKSLVTEAASSTPLLKDVTLAESPTAMTNHRATNALAPKTVVLDQATVSTSTTEKPSSFDNSQRETSSVSSMAGSYVSPSPSGQRTARVTPSPVLTSFAKHIQQTELHRKEFETSSPTAVLTTVNSQTAAAHSPIKWPLSSVSAVSSSKAKNAYSADLFSTETSTLIKNGVTSKPLSSPWAKTRSDVAEEPGQRSFKSNGGASIFPKTSPSLQAPKVIEEPPLNENGSSSSIRSQGSSFQNSSSPFRNSFGETRPTWAKNSANEDETEPSDANLSPSAVRRSWQNSVIASRSRFESSSTASSKPVESRPWQTESSKLSLPQQDRLQGDTLKAPTLSSIHRNSYIGNNSPVQSFKPTMKIKELAAAFESRSPEKSYVTSCDASTPSDEECGEIPMVSPPRVEEVRKSLNRQFGHI